MGSKSVATKRGRPKKSIESPGNEEKILDVAEELFAVQGIHSVSMREVARLAEVDAALPAYYFGNKSGLLESVFKRRAEALNDDKLLALAEYEQAAGKNLAIEGAIEAYIRPIIQRSIDGGVGWKRYFNLTAQMNYVTGWDADEVAQLSSEIICRYFDPVVLRLIGIIKKVIPGVDDRELYWAYHMMSGSLTLSLSETGRIDRLSNGLCRSTDIEALVARFVPYAAGGFRAVAAHSLQSKSSGGDAADGSSRHPVHHPDGQAISRAAAGL